jgi:hypothetical protein
VATRLSSKKTYFLLPNKDEKSHFLTPNREQKVGAKSGTFCCSEQGLSICFSVTDCPVVLEPLWRRLDHWVGLTGYLPRLTFLGIHQLNLYCRVQTRVKPRIYRFFCIKVRIYIIYKKYKNTKNKEVMLQDQPPQVPQAKHL